MPLRVEDFVTQASIVELAEVCETQSQNGLMSVIHRTGHLPKNVF